MPNNLHSHPLFKAKVELLSVDERVSISYRRARLVLQTYRLTSSDVQYCTPRFWEMMMDPICSLDTAMFTILAAHVGLTIGTLSRHLKTRPDLRPLVRKLLRFDTVGIYLLTERGHGLDSFNIETTATQTDNGYILHTPREEAAKFMPASTPSFGIPKVALVMARLIVKGEDHGCRYFIVPICNEREMYKGVHSVRLPPRSGTGPLDFSITTFDHVHLPPTALVASDVLDTAAPKHPLQEWWDENWRIQLGTLAVPAPWISATKAVAYIGGKYSMRRTLLGHRSEPLPIITFRTQQWPVVHATAVSMVMDNWYPRVIQTAMDPKIDPRVRHALSVIAKTTICRHFQRCVPEMAERCGAQGTFEYNYMARIENDGKGVVIAEGDILTLCIRLFSELLQSKYTIPLPDSNESLLAEHATSLLEENRALLKSLDGDYRSDSFNALVLPQSQLAIDSIGQAMAYSAAVQAKLPQHVLDIYECASIRQDPAWYSEHGIGRMHQRLREDSAVSSFMPHLDSLLDGLNIDKYVSAPIVSDASWTSYLAGLPVHTGNAVPEPDLVQAML